MYATRSAFDFPLGRIPSARCSGRSAPCCRAEEDVGEEGGLVRELSWDVVSLWSDGGKVGCFSVVEDKMKHTKRAILIFSKYCWSYNGNLCLCPLRCWRKGRVGSRFCCELNSSELFCIEFQWVSEQFRFVKAALLEDFSASVFVESTSSALPSCMQE